MQRLILLGCLAALTACAPLHAPTPAPPLDSVAFVRYGCYQGDCPAYRILLRSDGSAEWRGSEHSLPPGLAVGTLPPGAWRALSARVTAMGLDTLEDVYPSPAMESSRAEIRAYHPGWPPRVVATAGGAGPPELEALFAGIDSLAGTMGWSGLPQDRPTTGGLRPY